ncbi:MAG: hypothetical protein RR921_08020, partial [Mucinivorans sp.]
WQPRYLGLRAPTPRSVPRHGDLLVTVIKRRHASAQRLLIAGSNKKSRCRRANPKSFDAIFLHIITP